MNPNRQDSYRTAVETLKVLIALHLMVYQIFWTWFQIAVSAN